MKRSYYELMKEFEEKWNVDNITSVLDSLGIDYEVEKPSQIHNNYHVSINETFKEADKLAFNYIKHDTPKNHSTTFHAKYKTKDEANKLGETKKNPYKAA